MRRRTFFATPIALASLWGSAQSSAHAAAAPQNSERVPLVFSRLRAGSRGVWRNLAQMTPGDVSIQVDLWLRLDIDPPPAGGVMIRPSIRISEDSFRGKVLVLNSDQLQGKSGPNSNEVHIVGSASGVSHDKLFSPLDLDFSIAQALYYNPGEQSGATVSTVQGKDSYIIVTTG